MQIEKKHVVSKIHDILGKMHYCEAPSSKQPIVQSMAFDDWAENSQIKVPWNVH
jgi:hypothetical protein